MQIMLLDACVLADCCDVDPRILASYARNLGAIYITPAVLRQAAQGRTVDIASLGLLLVSPSVSHLEAAAKGRGRLSVDERIGVLMAQSHGWSGVSNEIGLHEEAVNMAVPTLWATQIIERLVEAKLCSHSEGEAWAQKMLQVNPGIRKNVPAPTRRPLGTSRKKLVRQRAIRSSFASEAPPQRMRR